MRTSAVEKSQGSTGLPSNSLAQVYAAPASTQIFEAVHAYDPMDWKSIRAQFNLDPRLVHLANFYLASYPKPVRDAIEHYRNALDNDPHSFLNDNMFAKPEQALWRHVANQIVRYVGGTIDEIALTG